MSRIRLAESGKINCTIKFSFSLSLSLALPVDSLIRVKVARSVTREEANEIISLLIEQVYFVFKVIGSLLIGRWVIYKLNSKNYSTLLASPNRVPKTFAGPIDCPRRQVSIQSANCFLPFSPSLTFGVNRSSRSTGKWLLLLLSRRELNDGSLSGSQSAQFQLG